MNFENYIKLKVKIEDIKEDIIRDNKMIRLLEMIISNPNITKEQILKELNIKKSWYYKYLVELKIKYNIDIRYLEKRTKTDKYKIIIY